ncbi:ATP-grasp domain-containing protein [Priestia megaterium]|uniref:ATP-grasp domain-containing protein n=1 Tax=Priestia megaterium TaxID=1404 RepID=UPI002E205EFA|nr:ATP-grasp domain-containing protein [Priestia megaterium]MED4292227.1 ATP-grasp domain-containing protein [Priestia megaterium]
MSILIINKTAYSKSPYDRWLKETDEDLIMLTSSKRKEECSNYKEAYFFENYEKNCGIEIQALELYNKHKFQKIIALSEYDLLRAARLREALNVKGQSLKSAIAFRDKIIMKEYLKAKDINVPTFSRIESAIDIYNFIKKNSYPVVIKPIDGMGSIGATVLHNDKELMNYLTNGLKPNMEIETFVEGDMYHIDGLILNEKVVHCWPSKYVNGCLAFHQEDILGSYQLDPSNPLTKKLISFTKDVLEALPTPENTSFHAEVFHTPNDELVFCEIASRTGGGLVRQAIQQGFGFDINQLVVEAQCDLEVNFPRHLVGKGPSSPSGWLLIPPKKGRLKKIPTAPSIDWVKKKEISAKLNQEFDGSTSSVDAIAGFCIVGTSEKQLNSRIQDLAVWFNKSTVWESI